MKIGFSRDVEVWMCGFQSTRYSKRIPVVMAKGSHLFPYRTQKLSLSAPMVLGWRRPGRVGHCRIPYEKASALAGAFSYPIWNLQPSGRSQPSTALYLARTGACRCQWQKQAGGASGIARGTGAERVLWTQSARRSVENRKERWNSATMRVLRVCCDYASSPD